MQHSRDSTPSCLRMAWHRGSPAGIHSSLTIDQESHRNGQRRGHGQPTTDNMQCPMAVDTAGMGVLGALDQGEGALIWLPYGGFTEDKQETSILCIIYTLFCFCQTLAFFALG